MTVVTGEVEARFTLEEDEEQEVLLALAEEERGEIVSAEAVLDALRRG